MWGGSQASVQMKGGAVFGVSPPAQTKTPPRIHTHACFYVCSHQAEHYPGLRPCASDAWGEGGGAGFTCCPQQEGRLLVSATLDQWAAMTSLLRD